NPTSSLELTKTIPASSYSVGQHNWTCEVINSNNDINLSEARNFTVSTLRVENQIYNLTTYETEQETFQVETIFDNLNWDSISAKLNYKGTSYPSTPTISGNSANFTSTIDIPEGAGNNSFYWNFTLTNSTTTQYIQSSTNNQTVEPANLTLCSPTNNVPYINFTFEDEETTSAINAGVDTSLWSYWLGRGNVKKSLTFSNVAENPSYEFCFNGDNRTLNYDVNASFSSSGYPQRTFEDSGTLTNDTTANLIYMLADADGIYTTLLVQNTAEQELSGVDIVVQRLFDSTYTIIDNGETDDSGTATFWVNPDYSHKFLLTKSGCEDKTYTVTPSLSSYTITMVCTGESGEGIVETPSEYKTRVDGIKWFKSPGSGILSPGEINFTYKVVSDNNNIDDILFQVVDINGTVYVSKEKINCNSSICSTSQTYNVTEGSILKGRYYVKLLNSTLNYTDYILLEGDAHWKFIITNVSDGQTLKDFFLNLGDLFSNWGDDTDCTTYSNQGSCDAQEECKWVSDYAVPFGTCISNDMRNKEEFSRFIFVFFLIVVLYSILNKYTGFDQQNPGIMIWFLTFFVVLGSVAGGFHKKGLFFLEGLAGTNTHLFTAHFLNNYILAITLILMSIAYGVSKFRRET
ncbi:MAG: hypothetical protein ACP5D2_03830, partial [Candidatus Nanoarchaeia archaeon]